MDEWLKQATEYFRSSWGVDPVFAGQVALLYAYLWYYGLNPQISSGFRDPAHQRALQAQWDAGNRVGLAVRPATDSLHSRVDSRGGARALAVDIRSTDVTLAGQIAEWLGIGWGGRFSTPDPIHFFSKSGSGGI